jgi:hypothetical protein
MRVEAGEPMDRLVRRVEAGKLMKKPCGSTEEASFRGWRFGAVCERSPGRGGLL